MRISRVHLALTSVVAWAAVAAGLTAGHAIAQTVLPPVPPATIPNAAPLDPSAPRAGVRQLDAAPADVTPMALTTTTAAATGAAGDNAVDAALAMANMLDGAGGGISSKEALRALEDAAAAGQPMALWRLGTMYENGDGVEKDPVKAFAYFSRIANDHADAAPKSLEADIVAESFVKIGEYYRQGLPDAGIPVDPERSRALLLHAATYFGDADAQYRVGEMYLDPKEGNNPLQGARWLSLAAHKGHAAAQARLGDLLFKGDGIPAQPVEGLMWLTLAHEHTIGTADETWITNLLDQARAAATPDERDQATKMAVRYDQWRQR